MTSYQINAINALWPFELVFLGVALIYLIFLKAQARKRLLLAVPSIIFFLLPLILIWATPDVMASVNRTPVSALNIFVFASYLFAIFLIISNASYVRTWLHWLQVINIWSAVATIVGWLLLGD